MWIKCSKCKKIKPLYSFGKWNVNKQFGIKGQCKECIKIANINYNKNKRKNYEPITTGTIKCKDCGEIKDIEEFRIARIRINGRDDRCKLCRNKESIAYYKKYILKCRDVAKTANTKPVLYSTFAPQLSFAHKVRRSPKNQEWLEVQCTYDQKWLIPTKSQVRSRLRALNGIEETNNFYCSEECKDKCPIFKKQKYQEGHAPTQSRPGQTEWAALVFERADGICEVEGCYEPAEVAHHINPVKTHPLESMDLDNGIAVCKKHNKEFHDEPGMRFVDLAQTKMCVIQNGEQVEI